MSSAQRIPRYEAHRFSEIFSFVVTLTTAKHNQAETYCFFHISFSVTFYYKHCSELDLNVLQLPDFQSLDKIVRFLPVSEIMSQIFTFNTQVQSVVSKLCRPLMHCTISASFKTYASITKGVLCSYSFYSKMNFMLALQMPVLSFHFQRINPSRLLFLLPR